MTSRFGLTEATLQKIFSVLEHYSQVEQAILYGSRAKGNYKPGSDIDLTLRGGADLTLKTLRRIMDELDDLLLPYTIDLSIYADINDAEVKAHIQRVGQVLWQRAATDLVTASRVTD